MEKFLWLDPIQSHPGDPSPILVKGRGFCTMAPHAEAYGTVAQIRSGALPGILVSASAVASLATADEQRYVLLRRSDDASIDPGRWQFPAGRCDENELPFQTACRELAEEIAIQTPEHDNWRGAALYLSGPLNDYLDEDSIQSFRGLHVWTDNTMEFYYRVVLPVTSFEHVELSDAEAWGRDVRLFTPDEVRTLARADQLTRSAQLITQKLFEPRARPAPTGPTAR